MPILKSFKHTEWNSVVDMLKRALPASFTDTPTAFYNSESSRLPADAITSRCSTLPAWMKFSSLELRLPFRHARCVAKREHRVEIRCSAGDCFAAPVAGLTYPVAPTKIRLPNLPLLPTTKRAILLGPTASANALIPADFTERLWRWDAPPAFQVAMSRAVLAIRTAIERMVFGPASLTCLSRVRVPHTLSIPHIEIEEKYCRIAVERLSQEVLDFSPPPPQPEQGRLL